MSTAYDEMKTALPNSGKVVLVVLERKDIVDDASVKRWGDTEKGIKTICLTEPNITTLEKDQGFPSNLAVKFNVKLDGKNHILPDTLYKKLHFGNSAATMVVGADVTHPGPSSIQYCPSVTAAVASTDRDCVTYPGSMRLQRSRSEVSDTTNVLKNNQLTIPSAFSI